MLRTFRVKDWLHGVRPAAPDHETQRSLDKEPLTEAERLRIVHAMLTQPESDGGAGITPGKGAWNYVDGIFPLHDVEFNKVGKSSCSKGRRFDKS
jgi:anoctamin-10